MKKKEEEAKKMAEEKKAADEKKQKAAALRLAQEQALEASKKKKQEKTSQMSEKMNQLMDQFSVTLNKKHFLAAMQVREEAKAEGLEDIQLHVAAANIYKKSFTFP